MTLALSRPSRATWRTLLSSTVLVSALLAPGLPPAAWSAVPTGDPGAAVAAQDEGPGGPAVAVPVAVTEDPVRPPEVVLRQSADAVPERDPAGARLGTARDRSRDLLVAPRLVSSSAPRSTWQVAYSGFDAYPEAKAAFQAGVDVWSRIIASPVPIKVAATFAPLSSGVLGSAGATANYSLTVNGKTSSYASALVDAITGADQGTANGRTSTSDIVATFTSQPVGFYFGTDGLPPAGQTDFETVVLHELGHGLGFAGSMSVASGSGTYSTPNPAVYDRFAYDAASGGNLVLAQPNGSAALAAVLQSGSVYWDSPAANAANGGTRAQLYAPAQWVPAAASPTSTRTCTPRATSTRS